MKSLNCNSGNWTSNVHNGHLSDMTATLRQYSETWNEQLERRSNSVAQHAERQFLNSLQIYLAEKLCVPCTTHAQSLCRLKNTVQTRRKRQVTLQQNKSNSGFEEEKRLLLRDKYFWVSLFSLITRWGWTQACVIFWGVFKKTKSKDYLNWAPLGASGCFPPSLQEHPESRVLGPVGTAKNSLNP